MNVHVLKCKPEYFEALISGAKTCECRINDRNYQLNDILILRECDSNLYGARTDYYTGRIAIYRVTHIVYTEDLPIPRDKAITKVDWAVMSVVPWNDNEALRPFPLGPFRPLGPECK